MKVTVHEYQGRGWKRQGGFLRGGIRGERATIRVSFMQTDCWQSKWSLGVAMKGPSNEPQRKAPGCDIGGISGVQRGGERAEQYTTAVHGRGLFWLNYKSGDIINYTGDIIFWISSMGRVQFPGAAFDLSSPPAGDGTRLQRISLMLHSMAAFSHIPLSHLPPCFMPLPRSYQCCIPCCPPLVVATACCSGCCSQSFAPPSAIASV